MVMLEALRSVARFPSPGRGTSRFDRLTSVADLRAAAQRRLPAAVFDYIDGGAEDEITLRRNVESFASMTFVPRILRDVSAIDPSVTLLGHAVPLPLVLAPTGFTRIAHPDGEVAVARAAARAGIPYTLSTLSTSSIEAVASAGGPRWFQVYVWRDRGLVEEMIARAREAGYEAIVLTVDTAVFGRRERDIRRGLTLPPAIGLDTLVDGVRHPRWTWGLLRSEPIRFANVTGRHVGDGATPVHLADYVNSQFDPALSWRDLDWLRAAWDGPIVLKGIQSVADARIAAAEGVDAVAVSNHGGRQLDRSPAVLDLVAGVRDVVGDAVADHVDGGVRRGSDIVAAVALGATACMVGRAYLYGLAAGGEPGVDHVLDLLDRDVRRTLALIGCRAVTELSREVVRHDAAGEGPETAPRVDAPVTAGIAR
jgi:L-lactate dehydrogenase (cytochrome)